ncbi:MAG: NAD(P)H:quinone oxidoreductase [Deltaproteobacteria bacterium]|nr:NAD(P)H:quinone oxidoreductase [Deltaproteobacteria bacterium]MBW2308961.1 NAD(P)H:quinone oxidoreductase [Deltaproteobacteria bacterium]
MAKILTLYYSHYGNVRKLALSALEGAKSVPGVEHKLARVQEVDAEEVIRQQEHRWKAWQDIRQDPEATLDDLRWADGLILATPTRFGNVPGAVKLFIDSWAPLWQGGDLIGKPATTITSTASVHGGQEFTHLAMWIPMLHMGMIIVGVPYSEKRLFSVEGGGSPYGASAVVGLRGERPPTEDELGIAFTQGARLATVASKLKQ